MELLNINIRKTMGENEAMFRGLFEGANLSGAQIIVKNEGTVVYHQHAATAGDIQHFPLEGSVAQGRRVFQQLIDEGFIAKDTDENSFMFCMGYSSEMKGEVKQIDWLKNKQLAREFVTLRNKKAIDSGQLKIAVMEKITERVFIMNGKPLELAKNKSVPSFESDRLKEIFATKAD